MQFEAVLMGCVLSNEWMNWTIGNFFQAPYAAFLPTVTVISAEAKREVGLMFVNSGKAEVKR